MNNELLILFDRFFSNYFYIPSTLNIFVFSGLSDPYCKFKIGNDKHRSKVSALKLHFKPSFYYFCLSPTDEALILIAFHK